MEAWVPPTLLPLSSIFSKAIHFRLKERHRLNMKGWKKLSYTSDKQKRGQLVIFISEKNNFPSKTGLRHREESYIIIKVLIYQGDIVIINTYASNIRILKSLKETLKSLKVEMDNTVIAEGINTPLPTMGRKTRQKIN